MSLSAQFNDIRRHAEWLFHRHVRQIWRRADRLFAWLLVAEFVAALAASLIAGIHLKSNHAHSWGMVASLAAAVCLPAVAVVWRRPGSRSSRYAVAVSQMLVASLLAHLSGKQGAASFYGIASIAFLALYRDWKLLILPTVFCLADRLSGGLLWPHRLPSNESALGGIEYCMWLAVVDGFLFIAIRDSLREMRLHAWQTAELEESQRSSRRQTDELNRVFAKERAIIEGALDAVIAVDRDGAITTWNCQAERIFGWTPTEAIGRRFTQLVLPEQFRDLAAVGLMQPNRELMPAAGQRRELVGLHRSGREFPIEIATTPIHYGDGVTFCAFVRDISDQKNAEHVLKHTEVQARRLALVAAHTHNAVVITDADQRIEWVNEAFTQITEYTLDEVIGRRPGDFLQGHSTDPAQVEFMRSRIRAGLPFQAEVINYSKSGREYWLDIEVQPLRGSDGRLTGFMAIEADITSRKQAEQELRRAKEQAESANQAKSAFLANMSHEIRTPLTGILGFADVLRSGSVSPQQTQQYLGIIHSCGSHLLTLLNDILDLSKIEAGRMDFEHVQCSPQQIVTDVLSLLRVRAQEKGLKLEAVWTTDVPETIHTDPARLRQLLMNLIANAIKFTERGSVSVLVAARWDGSEWKLEFAIRDTGIGIAPDQLDRVFLPFDQADNSITRKFGGTGLGLAISRHIALGLGGNVTVESQLGLGSTFKATIATGPVDDVRFLPLQLSESIHPARTPAVQPAPSDLRAVRVLLVEDGETNRDLISLVLTRAGAEVTCACNGQDGVEAAENHPFDVILMDMQMPVMDGYSATQRLRSGGCRLPIIALTAHAMRGDREKCLAAGCTGYLTKPIQIDRLIDAVAQQLDRDAQRTEPASPNTQNDSETAWAANGMALESLGVITSTLPVTLPKFREIIERFIAALSERRALMQTALNNQNWNDLAAAAHWLKGAGGTVGFECFTEPSRRLEQAARRGSSWDAENCLREIDCLIGRLASPESVHVGK
jgi:PAS domain S-box-containing protein